MKSLSILLLFALASSAWSQSHVPVKGIKTSKSKKNSKLQKLQFLNFKYSFQKGANRCNYHVVKFKDKN
jgi:hypothetical protein